MRNNLNGDVIKNKQFMFACALCWLALGSTYSLIKRISYINSNSLATVLHINKSDAAGNRKGCTPLP